MNVHFLVDARGGGPRRTPGLAALLALGLAAVALGGCGGGKASPSGAWVTVTTPADHAALFPLLGTPHDPTVATTGVSCAGCHPGSSFAEFSCTGCHPAARTDPTHLGVAAGYVSPPTSASCLGCHPRGTATMADHGRFFPIGTASHPATCAACHADPIRRSDPATLVCATCHGGRAGFAATHAQVKDFDGGAAGCVRCHGDDQVLRLADHQAAFPVAAGSATHDTACLHCHPGVRADKPFAADFAAFSCTACHQNPATDAAHAAVAGYQYADASCYGCHPGGSAGAPANHASTLFPIGAGSAHAAVTCAQCHQGPAADLSSLGCASCHLATAGFAATHTSPPGGVSILAVHTSQNASTNLALTGPACLRCHADSQVDTIASHPGGARGFGTGQHRTAGCLTCHSGSRTEKPFGTDTATTPGCAVCHPNGIPN